MRGTSGLRGMTLAVFVMFALATAAALGLGACGDDDGAPQFGDGGGTGANVPPENRDAGPADVLAPVDRIQASTQ